MGPSPDVEIQSNITKETRCQEYCGLLFCSFNVLVNLELRWGPYSLIYPLPHIYVLRPYGQYILLRLRFTNAFAGMQLITKGCTNQSEPCNQKRLSTSTEGALQ
jgi:hypothetical protein